MADKITAWSYSRWDTYRTCPRRAMFLYVEKRQEPKGPALEKGIRIHEEIERYLRDGGRQPKSVSTMKAPYKELRAVKPLVEMEVAYDDKWTAVDWFSPKAWCRIKIDAVVPPEKAEGRARIVDHKSGKVSEGKYDDQLELYGLAGLLLFPQATGASGELWFVEHDRIMPSMIFPRSDEKLLQKKWQGNVKKMLSDTRFEPRPGNYCRWCHFRKSNGGPCPY